MPFLISEFEQHLPETILKKGLSYFKKGQVLTVDEVTPGYYEASVEGTENYQVTLTIHKGTLNKATCNCPYTDGLYCKHVAAVIFYLQQDVLGISVGKTGGTRKKNTSDPASSKPSKKKARSKDLIDIILDRASKEELALFLKNLAEIDEKFASLLRHAFSHYNEEQSVKRYASDLRTLIKSIVGRDHYNSWRRAPEVGQATSAFVASAEIQNQRGHSQTAAMMAFGALEALTEAIEYIDDSDGYLGGCIQEALGLLYDIAESVPEPEVENLIRTYCLTAYKKKTFKDWDWHFDMVEIVAKLPLSTDEATEIIRLLNSEIHSHYTQDHVASLIHSLYTETDQLELAKQYRDAHLYFTSMRTAAVLEAMDSGRYEEAIDLLMNGIQQDKHSKPGLVRQWQNLLLEAYEASRKADQVIALSREIFLAEHYFDADAYSRLKRGTPADAWPKVLQEMLKVLRVNERFGVSGKVKEIFQHEEMWEELLQAVISHTHMGELEKYDTILGPLFSEVWGKYIFDTVMKEAVHANSRSRYESIAKVLIRLYRAGRDEPVLRVVAELRRKYKHRPAMMEVLAKF